MSKSNVALARAGYEALIRGDIDAVRELMAPDLTWSAPVPGPGDCLNRREAIAMLEERRSAGAIGELKDVVRVDDDRVMVVLGRARSTFDAGEPGRSPDRHEVISLLAFREGRVVSMHDYPSRDAAIAGGAESSTPVERRAAGKTRAGATERPGALIPFIQVADPERSIRFYETLGFELADTHQPAGRLDWALLEAGSARLMLARASAPIEPRAQGVLFYLYSRDLHGLRETLTRAGIVASAIADGSPGPRQEMRVPDPDGYSLMIAQIEE
jgi:ketosteroid isomerase-like protein/catechol 2,3-dioxygenase-like lactoylglutathione lyase family enzyme